MTKAIRILRTALAPRQQPQDLTPGPVTRAEIVSLFCDELYR